MADSTVTALTGASALAGTEEFYVVQSSADRKATATQMKTFAVGTPAAGKVLAGSTPDFTATPTLGASGTLGTIAFGNATSGTITLSPVAGALGTVTLSLPAATDTLVGKATTDTLTNKTLTSPVINGVTHTTATVSSVGYIGVPSNSKSAAYTTVLGDAGQSILHAAADDNARTFTIDSNANVAYAVGTVLTFINLKNTVTIAITTDTMTLANSSSTGSRTLALNGIATAVKVGSTSWLISGTGLT